MSGLPFAVVFVLVASFSALLVAGGKPHVVFAFIDDLGYADVGYHGNLEVSTPTIDALAAAGVKLENYYIQAYCTPARAALLTGRLPIHTGVAGGVLTWDQPYGLSLNETTLANQFKKAGYNTHAVGKWNLGHYQWAYTPTERGFDSFHGFYGPANDHFVHSVNSYTNGYGGYDYRFNKEVDYSANGRFSIDIQTQRAIDVITEYSSCPSIQENPLFIYWAPNAVHTPSEATQALLDKVANVQSTRSRARINYEAQLVGIDQALANITQALKDAGIWDNTILVLSADNGGLPDTTLSTGGDGGAGYNWPLRGCKGTYYEGGIKGVGFISGGFVPESARGSTYNGLFGLIDWFPTLIAGAANSSLDGTLPLDGVNQWSALVDSTVTQPRTELLINIDPLYVSSAFRSGDWKLLTGKQAFEGWYAPPNILNNAIVPANSTQLSSGGGTQLFNITADPTETTDVSSLFPDVVIALKSKVDALSLTAVPNYVVSTASDPNADPQKWNGVWTPWVGTDTQTDSVPYNAGCSASSTSSSTASDTSTSASATTGQDCQAVQTSTATVVSVSLIVSVVLLIVTIN